MSVAQGLFDDIGIADAHLCATDRGIPWMQCLIVCSMQ